MKTSSVRFSFIAAAGIAATSLAFSPVAMGQTADQTANSKTLNGTSGADNQSATTGAPSGQPDPDKANSKDLTNSLDKNPGTAATGSAESSATKDPSTATTDKEKQAASSSSEPKTVSDQQFLLKAAQGGMTEVELGKLAQEKGSASDVKEFGSRMVTDHSKVNADLKSLADKKGITVPANLDAKHQAMVDKFQHLSGPAFDKAYVRTMVKDHEKDAADFRQASTHAQDPDVKAFAGTSLMTIEMHLSDIKSIQSSMK